MVIMCPFRLVKLLLTGCLIIFFWRNGICQSEYSKQLIPYRFKNQWGFSDTAGNIVIQPKYKETSLFAPVYKGDKLEYLSPVRNKKGWGAVNKQGQLLIPCQYDSISIQFFISDKVGVKKNGKWGLYKPGENEIVPCTFSSPKQALDEINRPVINESLGPGVTQEMPEEKRHSQVLNEEIRAIEPEWQKKLRKPDGKMYLPGSKKEIFISPEELPMNSWVSSDSNVILAKSGNKWGLITTKGKVVVPFLYDTIIPGINFSDWKFKVSQNKKWGLISREGKIILPIQYDYLPDEVVWNISNPYYKGPHEYRKKDFIDPEKYSEYADAIESERSGMLHNLKPGIGWAQKDGKWQILNRKGKNALTTSYDDKVDLLNSLSSYPMKASRLNLVKKDGKYGMVEMEAAKEVVPVIFDTLFFNYTSKRQYLKDLVPVLVQKGGKFGLWVKDLKFGELGREVLPCVFDSVRPPEIYSDFSEVGSSFGEVPAIDGLKMLLWGKRDAKWRLYSSDGKIIFPEEFDKLNFKITWLEEQRISDIKVMPILTIQRGRNWGVITGRGKQLFDFIFDTIYFQSQWVDTVNPANESQGYFRGVAMGRSGPAWKTYDILTGKLISEYLYENLESLARPYNYSTITGAYKAKVLNGWKLISTSGKLLTAETYKSIGPLKPNNQNKPVDPSKEGQYWVVCQGDKFGVLNERGKEVIPIRYNSIQYMDGNLVKIRHKRKFGFIDVKSGVNYFRK